MEPIRVKWKIWINKLPIRCPIGVENTLPANELTLKNDDIFLFYFVFLFLKNLCLKKMTYPIQLWIYICIIIIYFCCTCSINYIKHIKYINITRKRKKNIYIYILEQPLKQFEKQCETLKISLRKFTH